MIESKQKWVSDLERGDVLFENLSSLFTGRYPLFDGINPYFEIGNPFSYKRVVKQANDSL